MQNNVNNLKKTWDIIKEVTNDNINKNNIKAIVNGKNETIIDPNLMSTEFNTFFRDVGPKLAKKIKPSPKNFKSNTGPNVDSCFLAPVTANDLTILINSLKNNVKSGEDQITSEILKQNHKYLINPLLHVINCIFSTGVFPSILKKATIVPVFKNGNSELPSNYRPIALISTISKLVEKCIKGKLQLFLDEKNLLSKHQFAFKKDSGAEDALSKVTEVILNGLDGGRRVLGIFLDLKKAFDTVVHHILLRRLFKIGIRGVAYKLIESYLKDRVQQVKIGNTLSEPLAVVCGVPQGTVLGPILFNIYMNEVLSILEDEGVVFCFADDTVIIVQGETWEIAIKNAEAAISKIKCWLDHSLLSLNVEKTKFIPFGLTARILPVIQALTIHDSNCNRGNQCACTDKIDRVQSIKYLGIFLDENLNWKTHVNYVTKKVRKLIHKFYELRNILSLKMLKVVYSSLVESIISYGIIIWGSASKSIISNLFIAQKYIIKIIMFKTKRFPTKQLFEEGKLLTLEQLYTRAVIRFMLSTQYYRNTILHKHNTRNATNKNLSLTLVKNSATQRHISYTGPTIYNLLPISLRNKPFKKVKQKICQWILENNLSLEF